MAELPTAAPLFTDGQAVIDAYFMKVDVAGHSAVVRNNPHDKADILFELVEDTIYDLVKAKCKLHGCAYADFWGWQGDGGICVFFDPRESVTNSTVLDVAFQLIDRLLPALRDDLATLGVAGEINMRVAIHKGSFKYKSSRGSIHSQAVNFVAHLEEATPRNTITISKDVYDAIPADRRSSFIALDFKFEDKTVFIRDTGDSKRAIFEWMGKVPISGSALVNMFTQRATQYDKAMMIRHARHDVVVLGTAGRTCSNYLVTKEKPGLYRSTVLSLLDDGTDYTAILLSPHSVAAKMYQETQDEDIVSKIEESIRRLEKFSRDASGYAGKFSVLLYDAPPRLACIAADRHTDGLLLVSPYMPTTPEFPRDRADTVHYLLESQRDKVLYDQINEWLSYCIENERTRRLI
jgi:class 3 adenylate cyclase